MKNYTKEISILNSHGYLWDGTKQLSGNLKLCPSQLVFEFDDFHQTHMNLMIELSEIEFVKVFLIYNIALHGLKIKSKDGKIDLFVLEDCSKFCQILLAEIEACD